ncbi:hypothetical protein FCH28_03910 [Streptomyces piniterrae]|uniref:DUF5666 domain-containing protein n=1 Tax=Streptomyces piniterrae TaxID=2571125 RepID=A0A4U0NWU0_9ACTN|nr:hypothetical protein [Streptomyces piniterrae]TJZ59247.1 hypothetical protein FCH28_03910 [Streptomyces piniterrae]
MIKRAVVTLGLVGALGCAMSAPAQAAASQATKATAATAQAQEAGQVWQFQGTITNFKDDYLVLATADGEVRFNLTRGADYCGKMMMGVGAVVDAYVENGEWVAQKIVTT